MDGGALPLTRAWEARGVDRVAAATMAADCSTDRRATMLLLLGSLHSSSVSALIRTTILLVRFGDELEGKGVTNANATDASFVNMLEAKTKEAPNASKACL